MHMKNMMRCARLNKLSYLAEYNHRAHREIYIYNVYYLFVARIHVIKFVASAAYKVDMIIFSYFSIITCVRTVPVIYRVSFCILNFVARSKSISFHIFIFFLGTIYAHGIHLNTISIDVVVERQNTQ